MGYSESGKKQKKWTVGKNMNYKCCPDYDIKTIEYLGSEDDGTPIFRCRKCGTVFEGIKK